MNLERELKRFVRQIRPGLIGATANPNTNLNQLIQELKVAPPLREDLEKCLKDFLLTRDFMTAVTETGLTLETGVFSEIYKRVEYKFLPKPFESTDILTFLTRVFDAQSDAQWLEKIDRVQFAEFLRLILPPREIMIERLAPQFFMSLEILSLRLAGLGYEPVITHRLNSRRDLQHSFLDLARAIHRLLDGQGEDGIPAVRQAMVCCAEVVVYIRSRRGAEGVSLAMTYRLMRINQVLRRIELLIELLECMLGEWDDEPAQELFFEILLAEIRRFDLGRFLTDNLEMLAYQITEHTGKTGEHYIARSRSEWNQMFNSAVLGGVIVAFLVIVKFMVAHLHLAPGPEGFAYGLVYASGFVLIHVAGGTLATKQPAMTASTLAASLDGAESSKEAMNNLCEVVVRTIRTQMVALLGNFLFAFPVAAFLCLPFNMFAHPLLDHEKAWSTIESLHPFHSLSFVYAAIAGLGLCGAGLIAGFADNWFVFNRVGERLKNSELLERMVGAHNRDRAIHHIDHNLGLWVGNITLGFYLGSMAAIGKILGLPIDIRHITFSSGQFGAALASLKFQIEPKLFALVFLSIFCIGLINLTVSFSLTLFIVIKSRKIKFAQTPELLRLLRHRFRAKPSEFFYPQSDVS